jgi:hypothetical protein
MMSACLRSLALLVVLSMAGCFQKAPTGDGGAVPEDRTTRLPKESSIDLASWLGLPREQLARLTQEQQAAAQSRLAALRKGNDPSLLLPQLAVCVQAPIFQSAAYRADQGISLPGYVKAGAYDSDVALHLARHGDQQAAMALADAALRPRVAEMACEKHYPLEWTRLVALTLAMAQLRLAAGEASAATDLIRAHEQLSDLLGPKARASALGSVLLGQGRRALQLAARAWRSPAHNKVGLAEDVEKALAAWGEVPSAQLAASGKPTLAIGDELARAVDLLGVPAPAEGLLAVATFTSADGRVAAVQLAYGSGHGGSGHALSDLAAFLGERGLNVGEPLVASSLTRQEASSPVLKAEMVRSASSPLLGGLATFTVPGIQPASAPLQRSLGAASLDLPFSVTRDELSIHGDSYHLEVTDREALSRIAASLNAPAPASARVEREGDADLASEVTVSWPREMSTEASARLIRGLWQAFGLADIRALDEKAGGGVVLRWQGETARAHFIAPFDGKEPTLTLADTREGSELAARQEQALALAEKGRLARIAAGKHQVRLAPGPEEVNGVSLAGLKLGGSREDALAALARLPEGKGYRHAQVPSGVSVTILTPPANGAAYWARQLLVRFAEDRVAEIRIRWQEGLAAPKKGESLPEKLASDPRAGAGGQESPTWAGLWTDVGPTLGQLRAWRDDLTERSYQSDGFVSEVCWRSRSDRARGPAAWRFLPQGPDGASLGDSRSQVLRALGEPIAQADGADIFRMPATSPYDRAFVWWEKDAVARIVAVERGSAEQAKALDALRRSWGRDLAPLGYVRRQVAESGQALGAFFWHDDAVRIQSFAQKDGASARILTEWRPWPIPAPAPTTPPAPLEPPSGMDGTAG